jgi:hypothetical protein
VPTTERNVAIVLALGLLTLAGTLAVLLSKGPLRVVGATPVVVNQELLVTSRAVTACQSSETLPGGTVAVRISISDIYGPRVTVSAFSRTGPITAGERGGGWTEDVVTVPVRLVSHTYGGATVCFALARGAGVARIDGQAVPSSSAARDRHGRPLPGRVRIEYLSPGHSWWSLASSVARRMGLGRASGGLWIVVFAIALMVVVALLAARVALQELR